ncbi:MAG: hypothetical protein U9Q15_01220, partial [Patescibacteria group bacterium]|nr:hypothetical protein [Patescibacteria group bacterium]
SGFFLCFIPAHPLSSRPEWRNLSENIGVETRQLACLYTGGGKNLFDFVIVFGIMELQKRTICFLRRKNLTVFAHSIEVFSYLTCFQE